MNTATAKDLKVGDGATWNGWSDRYAGTVIKRTANAIVVQEDKATLLNGFNSGEADALVAHPGGFAAHVEGRQRYSYAADSEGRIVRFTRRKNGRWVESGSSMRTGAQVRPGRHKHHDYNF